MSITALPRSPYLLVFRDASIRLRKQISPAEIGSLLHEWLQWHDLLELQGRLRFRSPVESETQAVSGKPGRLGRLSAEQKEAVVGYLLIDAESLDEVTKIARGCPGLAHGFTVEIYRPFGGTGECHPYKTDR